MRADIDTLFNAIHARRRVVWALYDSGKSSWQIANITGEHQTQVLRWIKVCSPRKPQTRMNAGFAEDAETRSVFTPQSFFQKNSRYFNRDGRPENATFQHPVDDIEPVEVAPSRANAIRTAALRYLLRQEDRPMEEVAEEIGCTRAAISRVLVMLSDRLGFAALNQKSKKARRSYSQARIRVAAARG